MASGTIKKGGEGNFLHGEFFSGVGEDDKQRPKTEDVWEVGRSGGVWFCTRKEVRTDGGMTPK